MKVLPVNCLGSFVHFSTAYHVALYFDPTLLLPQAFLVVIGLLWITEFFLIMFYDTYPSPTNVLLFLPITLLVIAACFACGLAMVVCCDHGEHEGNRRVQNSPV
jgi:cell division protein FtsW (lipid II flippase)